MPDHTTTLNPAAESLSLLSRGKHAPFVLFALCWLGNYFGGMISTLLSAYLPDAVFDLVGHLDDAALSEIGSYVGALYLIGWTLGGVTFGYLGDQVGRVRSFAGTFLLYAIFTLAASFVESWQLLVACRLLAGFGVGGMLVVSAVLVAEVWPDRTRAIALGMLAVSFPIGIMSAGVVNYLVADWRTAFLLGVFPLGFALLSPFVLHEPGRAHQPTTGTAESVGLGRFVQLFRPPHRSTFLVGATIFGSMLVGIWAIFSWLPTWAQSLIGMDQDGQQQRGLLMMLLGVGGIAGGIVGGFLANALGRKRSLLIAFAGAFTASFLLFKTNHTFTPIIYAETAFLAIFFGISQGILTAYVPELFPTAIRSTATGVCFNAGRVVTAGAVFFVGVLVPVLGGYGNAVFIFSLTYVLGFVATLFGKETKGITLREL